MDVTVFGGAGGLLRDRSLRRSIAAAVLAGTAVALPAAAGASVIGDAHFFDTIPSVLIDFETNGAGNPINLNPGERLLMPSDAYITLGVSFQGGPYWVNDANSAFQAALQVGGSQANAIPSSLVNQFEITFDPQGTVQAFGFWVVNNRSKDSAGPTFTAYDRQNNLIETVQFGGGLVDGTITTTNTVADYGFMGIVSDEFIGRVVVTKQAAILDDFRFGPVPTPGTLALTGVGGLVLARRRR